jgi:kynurenine formamidase
MRIPKFADLPKDDNGLPIAKGVWGANDQLGILNNISADAAVEAAKLIQSGRRFNLNLPLDSGFVSRGALIDLPRFSDGAGRAWVANGKQVISPDTLRDYLTWANVELKAGDVLHVRTGWLKEFVEADVHGRDDLFRSRFHSGLSGEPAMWQFLWDNRVAAVAADNVSVEILPFEEGRPSLHLAIARLGLILGELFNLEDLAADCAQRKTYTCFFASVPLNLKGGVGSPANAIAIR